MARRTVEQIQLCLADQASIVYPQILEGVPVPPLSLGDLRKAAEPDARILYDLWPIVNRSARNRLNTWAVRRTVYRAYDGWTNKTIAPSSR